MFQLQDSNNYNRIGNKDNTVQKNQYAPTTSASLNCLSKLNELCFENAFETFLMLWEQSQLAAAAPPLSAPL